MSDDQSLVPGAAIQELDAALVESEMLKKEDASKAQPIGNPEDLAAVFFQRNYPRMRGLVKNMSRRGMERALICAAAFPLVPKEMKPQSREEHELAWVLEQMVACKAMMIEATKLHKMNAAEESQVEQELSLNKGETHGE